MLDDYFPSFEDEKIRDHAVRKDNLRNFYSFAVTNAFPSHDGCVNTVKWDKSGQFILSGGDDRCVAITDVFSNTRENIVFRKELRAMSNIFIAKFIPETCDDIIYAGFRCGCVVRVSVNGGTGLADGQLFFSHKMPVYDILTPQDQQHCIITLSHDHTVRLWDTRLPHHIGRDMQLCAHSKLPEIAPAMRFEFPVTAGDVHPLDGSRAIALASADGFVRLFDLRRLFSPPMGALAMGSRQVAPHPYQIARPLGLAGHSNFSHEIRLDYGPLFITSVCFEPLHTSLNLSLQQQLRHRRFKSQYPGRRMLVSHMYSSIFLFDLSKLEEKIEEFSQPADQLPSSVRLKEERLDVEGSSAQPSGEVESSENVEPRVASVIFAMLLAGAVERRRAMSMNRNNNSNPENRSRETGSATDTIHGTSPRHSSSRDSTIEEASEGSAKEFEFASDEMIARVLASCPRARQIASYAGQRSFRTVIKDACFWGENFVISGSECGHVLAWDRATGEPVNLIKADTVVNRLQSHPFLPYLAVSGVDHTIKLLQPTPLPLDETEDEFVHRIEKRKADAAELMRQNLARTQQVVESSVSLRQQLASSRIGRMARLFLLQLAERQTGSGSTTAAEQGLNDADGDRDGDDDVENSDGNDDRASLD
ncbi:DDB1 and CUL4-associated factor 6 [Taenia crassiceps]|uniref:DDB1 and CUL4-associated factor 6 n=1 Tax=Taenia crassiceps TaxID=6207 RepID=A0ABR4Q730_9CEST